GRRGAGTLGGDAGGAGAAVPPGRAPPGGRRPRAAGRPGRPPRPAGRGGGMKETETARGGGVRQPLPARPPPPIPPRRGKVAHSCATDNVDHLGYLLQVCELELLDRERRAAERRLKAARLPTLKTLEDFALTA